MIMFIQETQQKIGYPIQPNPTGRLLKVSIQFYNYSSSLQLWSVCYT